MPGPLRLGGIPLQSIFKDELGMSTTEVSTFFLIVGIPNCIKWLSGLLSDRVRLFGSRRRSYIVSSTLLAAVLWAVSAVVPQRGVALVVLVLAINVAILFATTAVGGLLIDAGRAFGAVSRFSNVRQIAMNCASVSAHLIGGYLAGRTLWQTSAVAAALLVAMAAATAVSLRDESFFQRDQEQPGVSVTRPDAEQLRSSFLWIAIAVSFLYYLAPDPGDVLFRFQTGALSMSNREIGVLYTLKATGGLLGVLAYTQISKRIQYRYLLFVAIPVKIVAALLYLAYRSRTSAFLLDGLIGFFEILSVAAIQELAARAASPKHSAFSFALILGVSNFALRLAPLIASSLHDKLGLSFHQLLFVQAASLLAPLLVTPFVPRALTTEA
ncbi:MFS transporter [Sorangium sp. So ce321]|uniref:MFS transporter n=1 Tax=Sorangium sp. So ce321 TaxID=3133300 RepID=UPI003F5DDC42